MASASGFFDDETMAGGRGDAVADGAWGEDFVAVGGARDLVEPPSKLDDVRLTARGSTPSFVGGPVGENARVPVANVFDGVRDAPHARRRQRT